MHIDKCPVKFWYHHPAVAAEPAVEFLATSDGRLYCRVGNGKYESRGEVHAGETLEAWADTSVSIVDFVPHARRELVFTPVKVARGDRETFEAAAEVELTAGDTTRRLWLQRGDQGGMPIPVNTSEGTLAISYGYESLPLGFSLQLKKFTRGMNPGGMGDAAFASTVHLHDEAKNIDEDREISMNEPLVHGKYTFYQSGILPSGTGTVLTVACDPGLLMKYLGQHHDLCGHVDHVRHAFQACQHPAFPFFPNNDQDQGATHATCRRRQPGVCLPRQFGLGSDPARRAVRLECLAIAARPGRRPAEAVGQLGLGNLAIAGQSRQFHGPGNESNARCHGLLSGHAARFGHLGQKVRLRRRARFRPGTCP